MSCIAIYLGLGVWIAYFPTIASTSIVLENYTFKYTVTDVRAWQMMEVLCNLKFIDIYTHTHLYKDIYILFIPIRAAYCLYKIGFTYQ